MQWMTVSCSGGQYQAVEDSTVQWTAVLCIGGHYSAVEESTVQWRTEQCSEGQYCTVEDSTVQWRRVTYSGGQYCAIQERAKFYLVVNALLSGQKVFWTNFCVSAFSMPLFFWSLLFSVHQALDLLSK